MGRVDEATDWLVFSTIRWDGDVGGEVVLLDQTLLGGVGERTEGFERHADGSRGSFFDDFWVHCRMFPGDLRVGSIGPRGVRDIDPDHNTLLPHLGLCKLDTWPGRSSRRGRR